MALIPSTRYPAQTDLADGYPQGKARNAVTFQDGTGTPLEKDWINDLWGFEQALLGAAAITPSGTPDQVGASQYLSAVQSIATTEADGAEAAAKAYADTAADRGALLRLRQVAAALPFTDTGNFMTAIGGLSVAEALCIKSSGTDTHHVPQDDDNASATSSPGIGQVTGAARNGARLIVTCTPPPRVAISLNEGATWSAGSDLGATPDTGGIIYVPTHSRFLATYAVGVSVANDLDGASVWTLVSSGLTSAQGGIAAFSNGDVLVGGLDGASAVAMARSTNGGTSFASAATVPNASQYGDSGTIAGNNGTRIFHAGRANANAELRICSTTSALAWSLLTTITPPAVIAAKPRILMCQDTGLLVVVFDIAGATCATMSRDQGTTWSALRFYRPRASTSFGVARGRLFSSISAELYATDRML